MSRPQGFRSGDLILVTGASSGLGRALVCDLARRRCSLVLTGRDRVRLETVAREAEALGAPATFVIAADLSVPGGVEGLVESVSGLGRPVDALINNAGAGSSGPWSEGTAEGDRALIRLLVDAPLALTRALLPGWRARNRGAVLNVASTGAFQPGPRTAVYYAAKAFLLSWSTALRREERSWLAVTTVCPGAMRTGFARAAGKKDLAGAPGPERTSRIALQAWKKNRGLVVPGVFNSVMVLASRWAPPDWTAATVEAIQKSVRSDS